MRGTKVAYTTPELAKAVGLHPDTVRVHIRKNRMAYTRKPGKGGGFLIPRQEAVNCYRSQNILESILPTVLVIGEAKVQADGFQVVEIPSAFEAGLRIKLLDPLVIVVDHALPGLDSRVKRACPRAIVVNTEQSTDPLVSSAWGQKIVVEEPTKPMLWFTR